MTLTRDTVEPDIFFYPILSDPVLSALLSESVHELKARACKSAPEVRFDPGGVTRIDTPSDGVISSRVRNRKLARKDNVRLLARIAYVRQKGINPK